MNIKNIIKDNNASFYYYRKGYLYYQINNPEDGGEVYSFPVPAEDLGDATVNVHEKAIFLMRYIRKAIAEGTFVRS